MLSWPIIWAGVKNVAGVAWQFITSTVGMIVIAAVLSAWFSHKFTADNWRAACASDKAQMQAAWQGTLNTIRERQRAAIEAAETAARQKAERDAATLRAQIDAMQQQADADANESNELRARLTELEAADPKAAHAQAPALILRAIRGK